MPFLSYQKIGRQLGPLSRYFIPKIIWSNFEIANLFSIVERTNNYVFGNNMAPQSSRGNVYVIEFAYCLRIVFVIGKYAYIFQVGRRRRIFYSGILHGENLPRRWKFPRSELFRKNFLQGEFAGILMQSFFLYLAFSLLTQF